MKSKRAVEKVPVWDLSDLYKSDRDPQLAADRKRSLAAAKEFSGRYRGRLQEHCRDAEALKGVIEEYERIFEGALRPLEYAHLRFTEDGTDPKRGALLQNCREEFQLTNHELVFFELELLALPTVELERLTECPELARYRNFLRKLVASKPHRLSEREEQILADKRVSGASAIMRLFDEEFAAKKFTMKEGRRVREVNEAALLDNLHSAERAKRKAAADGLTAGLREESRRLTFIYNTLIHDKSVDDRYEQFATPEASRHLANQISQESVDAMANAIVRGSPVVAKYYRFKRTLLKLPKLLDYDRYAPVATGRERRYSFKEAKGIILDAAHRFSPRYAEITEQFFRGRWIHAAAQPGKRSGAFCSFGPPNLHPYVLVNYSGTMKEILTLAHELGHGVHGYLMRSQGQLNTGVPLTVAETASVFGEMLVFDYLREKVSDERAFFPVVCSKIEEIFATVFRQTAMFRFEREVHARRRAEGELSAQTIGEIWMRHQRAMFGGSVELRPDYSLWWSYIPHFIHSPFYVYAYSFGELLTLSLYRRYQDARQSGAAESFVSEYLAMLEYGDSRSPVELLAPFGIDLTSEKFWDSGISIVRSMVDEIVDSGGSAAWWVYRRR